MLNSLLRIILSLLVLLGVYFGSNSEKLKQTSVEFISVVDGDTIKVKINQQLESIRLIGIDAMELKENAKIRYINERYGLDTNTHLLLGLKAKEAISKQLVGVNSLQFEADTEERDQYGRLLAYIYLPDGSMLNQNLLALGQARVYRDKYNKRYYKQFQELEQEAKSKKLGIWQYVNPSRNKSL